MLYQKLRALAPALVLPALLLLTLYTLHAYYVGSTDTLQNTFVLGHGVHIRLEEPGWVPVMSADNIVVSDERIGTPPFDEDYLRYTKDPQVVVESDSTPAYVYVKITIPWSTDEYGFSYPTYFTYLGDDYTNYIPLLGFADSHWQYVYRNIGENESVVVLAYVTEEDEDILQIVNPGERTTPIFDTVKFMVSSAYTEYYTRITVKEYTHPVYDSFGNILAVTDSTGRHAIEDTESGVFYTAVIGDQSQLTDYQKSLLPATYDSTEPLENESTYFIRIHNWDFVRTDQGALATTKPMDIQAFAIQACHLLDENGDSPEADIDLVWDLVLEEYPDAV